MKKCIAIPVVTLILAMLACSIAWSEEPQEVRIGSFVLLRIRCAAGGYSIAERANAIQMRANNLLRGGKEYGKVTVKKSGKDANIYVDGTFFMTVGPGDARANHTTPMKLANIWAERLRVMLPKSTPDKPGVGRPGQEGAPRNAR